MLLCTVQYAVAFEDKKANMAACERLYALSKARGAELIVFPELSLTGFSLDPSLAELEDGVTVSFFRELAVRYGVGCVFGYAQKRGDRVFNVLAAVDDSGRVIAEYAKLHPFSFGGESRVYTAGDRLSVFTYNGVCFGLTICYDLRFPEIYRELSKSSHCIIVSANWGAARREHWQTLLKARAIEDQCYLAGCNCVCSSGMICGGESAIYSPDGSLIQRAVTDEALLFADISANEVHNIRSAFPQMDDRRPEIYRNFYE